MKTRSVTILTGLVAGVIAVTSAQFAAQAQVQVQVPSNVVGTGSNAWHYLIVEGESYVSEMDEDPTIGFGKVYADEAYLDGYGTPILATNTSASKRGALGSHTIFSQWADKVTYQVVFDTPGTYYMYMRFTMFENGGNLAHYLNEDSFFLPPGFNKDPQNDWPIPQPTPNGQSGGYCEGCCASAGFLYFPSVGDETRIANTSDTNYWEGNFHWNDLISSQFLNPATMGEPSVRFQYEVTPAMVGVAQDFTVGYREGGITIDLFLFSTRSNLMTTYTQGELDQLLVNKVQKQDPANVVVVDTNSWPYFVMEAENFHHKANPDGTKGFTSVAAGSTNVDFYGTPVLNTNTLASKKGALYTMNPISQWSDKATYWVQFATPGTYYMYMRFTMFENGQNAAHYLNEDSFFLPPDFNKDPQNDWPLTPPPYSGQTGGYCEGCCASAGWLYFPSVGDETRIPNTSDTNYWEGNFHWNDLISSHFLNPATTGEPNVRFKYEVTPAMVGVPQEFTIGSREGGVTPDLFMFSTCSNLMTTLTQTEMDQLFVLPKLQISRTGANVDLSWPTDTGFILESADSTISPVWVPVMDSATVVGLRNNLTVAATGTKFYRLRQP